MAYILQCSSRLKSNDWISIVNHNIQGANKGAAYDLNGRNPYIIIWIITALAFVDLNFQTKIDKNNGNTIYWNLVDTRYTIHS